MNFALEQATHGIVGEEAPCGDVEHVEGQEVAGQGIIFDPVGTPQPFPK